MAFADFIDLQTAVIEQVGKPEIADVMPRLVKLAEARFNRELRFADQMDTANLTVASGVASLPADFAEAIGLFDAAGCEYVQQPAHMLQDGYNRGFYAISGDDLLCNVDGDKSLHYYAALTSITSSMTGTNWLLSKYPGVYLYGVTYEAAKYLRDLEGAAAAKTFLDGEMSDARAADTSYRYSRARVTLPGVTP